MAFLTQLTVTRWMDPLTEQRVPAGTHGATKITEKTGVYFIVDKDGGRVRRINTGKTDRRAAQAMLTEYHKQKERGEVGLRDPFKDHLDAAILDHLAKYVEHLRRESRSDYPHVVQRELRRLFAAVGADRLRDLDPDRVEDHLHRMGVAATTKNKLRSYLFTFFEWLLLKSRYPRPNPIARVQRANEKKEDETRRRRRALTPRDLVRLLDAVESYPIQSHAINKGGRPRKDGTRPGPSIASLSPERVAALTQTGRERRLMVRVALLTGLRRGELSRVQVRHFLPKQAVLDIPGSRTKNGRRALIPIPKRLNSDLRYWSQGRSPSDPLFSVPKAADMTNLHKRHLRAAGIAYETEQGFADWHSLRKTTNTYLRKRKVDLRLRQRFMRHAAADLTTDRYDDERLKELAPVVRELARLDRRFARKLSPSTGGDPAGPYQRANPGA